MGNAVRNQCIRRVDRVAEWCVMCRVGRTLAHRTLAYRTLAHRTLAHRTSAHQMLAHWKSDRRILAPRTLADLIFACQRLARYKWHLFTYRSSNHENKMIHRYCSVIYFIVDLRIAIYWHFYLDTCSDLSRYAM